MKEKRKKISPENLGDETENCVDIDNAQDSAELDAKRDEVLRQMLQTPPKQNKDISGS